MPLFAHFVWSIDTSAVDKAFVRALPADALAPARLTEHHRAMSTVFMHAVVSMDGVLAEAEDHVPR